MYSNQMNFYFDSNCNNFRDQYRNDFDYNAAMYSSTNQAASAAIGNEQEKTSPTSQSWSTKRQNATKREKERVHQLNKAFDELKQILSPKEDSRSLQMTKQQILLSACETITSQKEYISYLEKNMQNKP